MELLAKFILEKTNEKINFMLLKKLKRAIYNKKILIVQSKRLLKKLRHPNIVAYKDSFIE